MAVLQATAKENPKLSEALLKQASNAHVFAFENTGAGFFSSISILGECPLLPDKPHLNGAEGSVEGIEHGMGFIVFLENGRVHKIEGYCNAGSLTTAIDFSSVPFQIEPWSASTTKL